MPEWKKSSASNPQGNCLYVRRSTNDDIVITESDDPYGTLIFTSPANFQAFIDGVKAGEFDEFGVTHPGRNIVSIG